MNLAYLFRLLCLSFACFAVLHLLFGAMVRFCSPALCRRTHQLSPSLAANLCFTARVLPAFGALLVVLAICIPSYLEWEPLGTAEPLGPVCLCAAGLGLFLWSHSLLRTMRALAAGFRFDNAWNDGNTSGPQIALAGLVNPRIVVSDLARKSLTGQQLDLAIRHERAHQSQRDNLKRLLLVLTPNCSPFGIGLAQLERSWAKFAEWAADDSAAVSREESLALADALVRIARLQFESARQPVLWTSFLADGQDLAVRVERLLRRAPKSTPASSAWASSGVAALLTLAAVLGSQILRSDFLNAVHRSLEILIH